MNATDTATLMSLVALHGYDVVLRTMLRSFEDAKCCTTEMANIRKAMRANEMRASLQIVIE